MGRGRDRAHLILDHKALRSSRLALALRLDHQRLQLFHFVLVLLVLLPVRGQLSLQPAQLPLQRALHGPCRRQLGCHRDQLILHIAQVAPTSSRRCSLGPGPARVPAVPSVPAGSEAPAVLVGFGFTVVAWRGGHEVVCSVIFHTRLQSLDRLHQNVDLLRFFFQQRSQVDALALGLLVPLERRCLRLLAAVQRVLEAIPGALRLGLGVLPGPLLRPRGGLLRPDVFFQLFGTSQVFRHQVLQRSDLARVGRASSRQRGLHTLVGLLLVPRGCGGLLLQPQAPVLQGRHALLQAQALELEGVALGRQVRQGLLILHDACRGQTPVTIGIISAVGTSGTSLESGLCGKPVHGATGKQLQPVELGFQRFDFIRLPHQRVISALNRGADLQLLLLQLSDRKLLSHLLELLPGLPLAALGSGPFQSHAAVQSLEACQLRCALCVLLVEVASHTKAVHRLLQGLDAAAAVGLVPLDLGLQLPCLQLQPSSRARAVFVRLVCLCMRSQERLPQAGIVDGGAVQLGLQAADGGGVAFPELDQFCLRRRGGPVPRPRHGLQERGGQAVQEGGVVGAGGLGLVWTACGAGCLSSSSSSSSCRRRTHALQSLAKVRQLRLEAHGLGERGLLSPSQDLDACPQGGCVLVVLC